MQLSRESAADRLRLAGKRRYRAHVDVGELRVEDEDGLRLARIDVCFSVDTAREHAKAKWRHLNRICRRVNRGLEVLELHAAGTPLCSGHVKGHVERLDCTLCTLCTVRTPRTLRTLRTLCTLRTLRTLRTLCTLCTLCSLWS